MSEPRVDRRPALGGRFWSAGGLRDERIGVMLHYDGSTSDAGSVAWFQDSNCRAGYHYLVLDSGEVLGLAPFTARAWHAGVCRPSDGFPVSYRDANSGFVGVAVAATAGDLATFRQVASVARICREVFAYYGWPLSDAWRITTHGAEAWERGRKVDPGRVLRPGWVRAMMPATLSLEAA